MKKVLLTLITPFLCLPFFAHAVTITNTNVSSSNSGGVVSGQNGKSVVTGDTSASSIIRTNINSSGGESTVDIQIETEQDGQVQTEERHFTVPEGAAVEVHVGTSSGSVTSNTTTRLSVTVGGATSSGEVGAEAALGAVAAANTSSWGLFSWIPKLFSFFNFF